MLTITRVFPWGHLYSNLADVHLLAGRSRLMQSNLNDNDGRLSLDNPMKQKGRGHYTQEVERED